MSAALRYTNNKISSAPSTSSATSLGFPIHVSHVTAAGHIDFRSGPAARRAGRSGRSRNLLVSVTNGIINRSRLRRLHTHVICDVIDWRTNKPADSSQCRAVPPGNEHRRPLSLARRRTTVPMVATISDPPGSLQIRFLD